MGFVVGLIFECIENGNFGSDFVLLDTWSVLLMFLVAFCVILVQKHPETNQIKTEQNSPNRQLRMVKIKHKT